MEFSTNKLDQIPKWKTFEIYIERTNLNTIDSKLIVIQINPITGKKTDGRLNDGMTEEKLGYHVLRGGTRTRNLRIRSPTHYPLGHTTDKDP